MIANPNDGNSPRVEVATPTIDVSAGGLITATTEQEKGYVPAGSKSATQQLTTQGAKTVTPGTTNQTAVASGRYTTGAVTVKGDANLVPENIAEGVSIFGVTGTLSSAKVASGTFNANGELESFSINCGFEPNYGVLTACENDLSIDNYVYSEALLSMYCLNGSWTSYGLRGDGNYSFWQRLGFASEPVEVSYSAGKLTFNLGTCTTFAGQYVYSFYQV